LGAGKELDEFMGRHGGWGAFDRVVYVGDGGNDFCPVLRLRSYVSYSLAHLLTHPFPRSQDVALVRSYRELSRRIAKEGESSGQKCSVEYWGGAWEVEKYLLESSK
jgi:pyridoxal phosphate phosphatase PHOSPHO2